MESGSPTAPSAGAPAASAAPAPPHVVAVAATGAPAPTLARSSAEAAAEAYASAASAAAAAASATSLRLLNIYDPPPPTPEEAAAEAAAVARTLAAEMLGSPEAQAARAAERALAERAYHPEVRAPQPELRLREERPRNANLVCSWPHCATVAIPGGTRFKRCSACNAVYCSRSCQTEDWPRHRPECKAHRAAVRAKNYSERALVPFVEAPAEETEIEDASAESPAELAARLASEAERARVEALPMRALEVELASRGVSVLGLSERRELVEALLGAPPAVVVVAAAATAVPVAAAAPAAPVAAAAGQIPADILAADASVDFDLDEARRLYMQAAAAGDPEPLNDLRRIGFSPSGALICRTCFALPPAGAELQRCSGCEEAHYCGAACQRADWDPRHKDECGRWKAAQAAQQAAMEAQQAARQRWRDRPLHEVCWAAGEGDVAAQAVLGICYYDGAKVLPKSSRLAAELYSEAAAQGDAASIYKLGLLTRKGEGVVRCEDEATRLYWLATKQGFAPAMFSLAKNVNEGVGCKKDQVLAVLWMRRAAELGNTNAQSELGRWYMLGAL